MEVGILGPLRVTVGDTVVPLRAAKERAVVTALALQPGRAVPVERLVDLVWGDMPPRSAPLTLRSLVSRVRRALGHEAVVSEQGGMGYRLEVVAEAIDAERFATSLVAGEQAWGRGELEQAEVLLCRALGEWRGDPLVDLADTVAAMGERARLEEQRLEAIEARFDVALSLGRHRELVGELEAHVAEHPWSERLWGQLMVALYRAERQTDALRAFQRARAVLVEELALSPGPRCASSRRRCSPKTSTSVAVRRSCLVRRGGSATSTKWDDVSAPPSRPQAARRTSAAPVEGTSPTS